KPSSTTRNQDKLLSMLSNFCYDFTRFKILCNRTKWYFQNFVFPLTTRFTRTTSTLTRLSNNVLAILEVKQRPHMATSTNDNVTTTATITTIRTTTGNEFFSSEMSASRATCS